MMVSLKPRFSFSAALFSRQAITDVIAMVKAAIYARVSSTANKDGAGISRQTTVCKQKCKEANTQIACQVAEVISGSLPLQQRNVFNNLLKKCHEGKIAKVFVEGSRAFARNAFVAEAMYEKSKELGVQIVRVDLPDLCAHQPNPAQKFLRRVMFAYTELEKDMTVSRLQHGWNKKMSKEKKKQRAGQKVRLNQNGQVKINGRKGSLETNLSLKQRKSLRKACKMYKQGKLTVRTMAKEFSATLKKKQLISPETARRLFSQIQNGF